MNNLSDSEKKALIKRNTPHSPILKNSTVAFLVGGGICLFAEGLRQLYLYLGSDSDTAQIFATLSIVVVGAFMTALGVFDRFARHAGAGTLVPITGFSNSIVASAIDAVSEGYVLGLGSKIFTVAGPVLLYATVTGIIYGLIYYIIGFI